VNTSNFISKLMNVIIFILLSVFAICIIYPILWMFISGFKSNGELFNSTWSLPKVWNVSNYTAAWNQGVGRYFLNSVIVTLATVVLALFFSATAAYALSRFEFWGKKLVFILVIGGLMLSPEVSLISLYKLLQNMHLYNTYWALIIPYTAFRIPFTIFLLRAYFLDIPREIEEAAYIDGCSSFKVFTKVIIPMSKPILSTAALLTAMASWNEFMFALVFIEDDSLRTIPIGLANLRGAFSTNWAQLIAGIAISSVTMIVLFIVFQKQFVRGLTSGGVKG
jgi:raffinose/stachyose/melibiose transport system permease protein